MEFYIKNNIKMIIDRLSSNGYEAYLVGGCVRDLILGRTPKDFDIATSATPDEILDCFLEYKTINIGKKYGTVTVIVEDEYIEVTTFRKDGQYFDNRHPEKVEFTKSLEEDLMRRDFTINAMAYNEKTGVIDYYDGCKDLFLQKIRAVGDPDIRFKEDALRMMRALRLSAELCFKIEDRTSKSIHYNKALIYEISNDRIRKELEQLLLADDVERVLTNYKDIIGVIIPEIKHCVGFVQNTPYHKYDVWKHSAVSVANAYKDFDVRLALMLHDIAKPKCCVYDDEGDTHFPNHEKVGAIMAEDILKRLMYPKEKIETVTKLIRYHYITPINERIIIKNILSKIGKDNYFKLAEVMIGDTKAKQDFCLDRIIDIEGMKSTARRIIEQGECYSLETLKIKGDDIVELGIYGKEIGEILNKMLNLVINEVLENKKEDLIEYVKEEFMENSTKNI